MKFNYPRVEGEINWSSLSREKASVRGRNKNAQSKAASASLILAIVGGQIAEQAFASADDDRDDFDRLLSRARICSGNSVFGQRLDPINDDNFFAAPIDHQHSQSIGASSRSIGGIAESYGRDPKSRFHHADNASEVGSRRAAATCAAISAPTPTPEPPPSTAAPSS
ncbi:MAG: hypothetical protein HC774_03690 [Sphingomonadales bacterium]|nr:hypothetical protein [Sphingomonadales bacterium]